jgi:predicted hotdog family 3-hydroxylacyl-ACP dehydratase
MTLPPLSELLPHRPPMLWLDELLSYDESRARCRVTVRTDHPFFHDDELDVTVCIEWMAQAVATLVGLRDRAEGSKPREGYLIAIPEATFEIQAFALNETLEIEATRIWGDDRLASFMCRVERDGTPVARAQLSVYRNSKEGE